MRAPCLVPRLCELRSVSVVAGLLTLFVVSADGKVFASGNPPQTIFFMTLFVVAIVFAAPLGGLGVLRESRLSVPREGPLVVHNKDSPVMPV